MSTAFWQVSTFHGVMINEFNKRIERILKDYCTSPMWTSGSAGTTTFQGPTKEAFSGSTISTLGNQNVDHVSILIDGPPKIAALTLDGDEEFIEVPDVAESSLFPRQSSGVGRSEFLTPVSDRLVADKNSSLCKQVFYVSKAQGEPMLRPDSVTDDFR